MRNPYYPIDIRWADEEARILQIEYEDTFNKDGSRVCSWCETDTTNFILIKSDGYDWAQCSECQ